MAPSRLLLLLASSYHFRCSIQAYSGFFVGNSNALGTDGDNWVEAFKNPNATGSFTFTAPNVTQSWPGSSIDGWTISMAVKADIQLPNNSYTTGTDFTISAPSSLLVQNGSSEVVEPDPSWVVCLSLRLSSIQGKFTNDSSFDSSCKGSLSDECISDIKNLGNEFAGGLCRIPDIPSSCPDGLREQNAFGAGLSPDFNGSSIGGVATDVHELGDNSPYDNAVKTIWPIIISWECNGTAVDCPSGQTTETSLICLQADELATGSRVPGAASGRMTGFCGWALLSVAVAAFLGAF